MAKPKYTVTLWMAKENGEEVPFDSLTPEEKKKFEENAGKRLSSTLNRYFAQHPEQYEAL
ncbi:MAG: hypothetical protein NC110_05445 [Ruminococcus sp.]|nr:hypothetical protein [Ruminococcus sp.]